MASDEVRPKVFRSGSLYLVRRSETGVLVRKDGTVSAPTPWGSLIAHVHVDEPWELIDPGSEDLPDAVIAAARIDADEESAE